MDKEIMSFEERMIIQNRENNKAILNQLRMACVIVLCIGIALSIPVLIYGLIWS